MAEYKIEKGIPIPKKSRGRSDLRAQIKALVPGDSFLVPDFTERNAAYRAASLENVPIVVRAEGKGFRIWRSS